MLEYETSHIATKKPATAINNAAQEHIRNVDAEPVCVAVLPVAVPVDDVGMAGEPVNPDTNELATLVEVRDIVVLEAR